MTNEMCTVPQLVIRVDPVPRESPRGYLCRVAHTHRYSGPYSILQIAGVSGDDLERVKGIERISRVLRLEPEEWQAMCYRELAGRKGARPRSFGGEHIKYSDLNYMYPRLCPACLRDQPIWWAVWDLRLVAACPLHRCLLLCQCPNCKRRLLWQRPAVHMCHCGLDFRDLTTEEADRDLLAINTLIYHAAGFPLGDEVEHVLAHYCFPKEMLKLRMSTLLRLVLLLGSIRENGRLSGTHMTVDNRSPAAATEVCRAAVTMLRDWPGPLHETLRNMLPMDTDRPETLTFNTIFGEFYRRLFHDLPRRKVGFLRRVFEDVVMENWKGFIRGSHRRPRYFSAAVMQSSYWVTLSEAARLAHASCRRILDAISQGQIESMLPTKTGNLECWMIKRESLHRWIAIRDIETALYMSNSEIQRTLGLGYKAVKSLAQAGLIRHVKGYNHLFSGGYHFLREDVTKVINIFQKHTVTRRKYTGPGKLMTLRDALNCLGHSVLPDLIQAADDGDLVPVHYAKLSVGIAGYIFPFEKLSRYHRDPKILPGWLINPHPVSAILESERMRRLLHRQEMERTMGPHRRATLKSSQTENSRHESALPAM